MKSTETDAQSRVTAPIGLRLAAAVIDCLIVGALLFAASINLVDLFPDLVEQFRIGYVTLCATLVFIVYHTVSLWLLQQTPGKALVGVRVVRFGKKPGFLWALGRSSIGYLLVDLFGIGLAVALFNRKRQTLHDYVFSSTVMVEDSGALNVRRWPARFTGYLRKHLVALKKKNRVIAAVVEHRELPGTLSEWWQKLSGYWAALQSLASPPLAAGSITTAVSGAAIAAATVTLPVGELLDRPLCPPNCPSIVVPPPPPPQPPAEVKFLNPVTSRFQLSAEGWTVSGDARGPRHGPGEISAQDEGKLQTWYWLAPQTFLGDKSAFVEPRLSFELKTSGIGVTDPIAKDGIILRSSEGLTLVYHMGTPGSSWTSYCVPLDESVEWRNKATEKKATPHEIQLVLKNLHVLQIRGEYKFGTDTGSLKNVSFGDAGRCEHPGREPARVIKSKR